ncbi:MAG: trmB [Ilumatobacteraceae bacterium]|nr:trmB [Ilumatobacteraceae bacterium]
MSPTRQRAFEELLPRYAVVLDELRAEVEAARPIIVEIGCGKGDATAAMAPSDDAIVVACEPNGAMLANLAVLLDDGCMGNVRLWLGDAFDLLAALGPAAVAEIRIWFPDPWPKPRHAGKRLVLPLRLALLVDALRIGGVLRLATDDPAYAAEALDAIAAEPRLVGHIVQRPATRPVTRFEARGLRDGRAATDIEARRTS